MLQVMRDPNESTATRCDMAKAAAPYVHARLSSTEVTVEEPPCTKTSAELRSELVRDLVKWGVLKPELLIGGADIGDDDATQH